MIQLLRRSEVEKEVGRQLVHMALGLCLAFGIFIEWVNVYFLLGLLIFTFALGAILKLRHPVVTEVTNLIERPETAHSFPLKGVVYYLAGSTVALYLFDPLAALCGILILAIGDSISTLYGKHFGRIKFPWCKEKHMEGAVLGAILAALVCGAFIPFEIAVAAAVVGALIDSLPNPGKLHFDDNFWIPLASAAVIAYLMGA